jgi:hypothetical protein
MFRITGLDGQQYYAKDIVELQQWVNEGRITPQMMIEDMSLARTTPASQVPGLQWGPPQQFQPQGQQYQPPSTPFRPTSQPGPDPGVDPRNIPRNQPYQPQTPYPRQYGGPVVQAPFVKAIIATACCCLPLGVVSLVYASQVSGHMTRGDYLSAQQAAKNADTWANVSIAIGVVGVILQFAFGLVGGMMGG